MVSNKAKAILMIVIGLLYLANFFLGVIEVLPDNLPFIGNIDEGVAGALVWQGYNMLRRKK